MWKMNAQGKKFTNVTQGIFIIRNKKRILFWENFIGC
jgi:hypothetical protein